MDTTKIGIRPCDRLTVARLPCRGRAPPWSRLHHLGVHAREPRPPSHPSSLPLPRGTQPPHLGCVEVRARRGMDGCDGGLEGSKGRGGACSQPSRLFATAAWWCPACCNVHCGVFALKPSQVVGTVMKRKRENRY